MRKPTTKQFLAFLRRSPELAYDSGDARLCALGQWMASLGCSRVGFQNTYTYGREGRKWDYSSLESKIHRWPQTFGDLADRIEGKSEGLRYDPSSPRYPLR